MQRRLRGGGARVGCGCSPRRGRAIWLGGPPLAVPPPCPGVTQQGAPGSSFEDQPVCGSRWPGWGPPRPGSGPVGVSWQGIPDPPLAPGPPSSLTPGAGPWLEGCGLRTGKETKSRPLLPQEAELSLTPFHPVWGSALQGLWQLGPSRKWEGWGPGAKHGCRPASCPAYSLGRKVKGGDRPHTPKASPGPSIC